MNPSGHSAPSSPRKLTRDEISLNRTKSPETGHGSRIPVTLVLDNIRSLYNVGSIFRSADGAGISNIILTGYTPVPPRKEIEKTALGATASVPWEYVATPGEVIDKVRSTGARICVLEQTTSSTPYYTLRPSDLPVCLVVGNEMTGVSAAFVSAADAAIDIPMYGMKHSLNVAVATGIVLFDLVRILADATRRNDSR